MTRAPLAPASAELREKGSRFLAFVERVETDGEAGEVLNRIREHYPAATHHCWAWRLGEPPAERSSDDGELRRTAGMPILHALRFVELTDVLAVVVRWFGGTKLGKGGLIRAYGGVVREALSQLATEPRVATYELLVHLSLQQVGALRKLIHSPGVEVLAEEYEEQATFRLRVEADRIEALREELAALRAQAPNF